MTAWTCDFCGGKATAAQGDRYWCSAPSCEWRRECETCEPNFFPFMEPTPMQRLVGWFLEKVFNVLPASAYAIIYRPESLIGRWSIWVCGNGRFWGGRKDGLV